MTKRLIPLILILILAACVPAGPKPASVSTASPAAETAARPWWRDAVFYEIFVRSFYDTNSDGVGDFNGITAKLDYLQDLGITGIWLTPINPSPSYHGYDVTNYYNVNPDYGTMEDFKRLLDEAHKRGIRVIMDLVLNHTSSQNPFFADANNNPDSKYRDWYVWSDTDPGKSWYPGKRGYYYGFFCNCMPDLNYRNPEVTAQMQNVLRFWLNDVGVDGFRVDAAKYLIEEGDQIENTPATHEWYKDNFYPSYKADNPNAYTVGEVYGAGAILIKSYTGNQLDQVFNFEMSSGFLNSAAGGSNSGVNSAIKFSLKDMPNFNFATFLTNHDQNRVMSVLNGDVNKAKVAAALLLTSPGTPFIYYGEEIGQQGKKPDENIRLPMQWSADANAGFTTDKPWRAPFANYQTVNVAAQQNDPNSLLSLYKSLIRLRADHSALRTGGILLPDTASTGLFASLRFNDQEAVLVLVNLSGISLSDYSLTLDKSSLPAGTYQLSLLLGADSNASFTINADGGFSNFKPISEIPPCAINIYQLNP
ncbi:MAG: alpha-amylase [Chloroflexi bacterium]|nr:alpha-amylase [Chloroflexota bacterium]